MKKNERTNKAVMGCEGADYHAVMRASVASALRKQAGFMPGKVEPIPDGLSEVQLSFHVSGLRWHEIIAEVRREIRYRASNLNDRFEVVKSLSRISKKAGL